jgi:cytoskeleton protein RodZ
VFLRQTYDERALLSKETNVAKEQSVGSFGERLRREREMRGISLDEIATATKISARNLRALEEEKFNQLPGGIFNKGFVRAYAKFLGIDQDHMVAEYVSASHDVELAREQKLSTDLSQADFKRLNHKRDISLEPKSQWGTVAAIVLLAALGFGGYEYYQKSKAAHEHAREPFSPILPVAVPQPEGQAAATQPDVTQPGASGPGGTGAGAAQPGVTAASTPQGTPVVNPTNSTTAAGTLDAPDTVRSVGSNVAPANTAATSSKVESKSTEQKPNQKLTPPKQDQSTAAINGDVLSTTKSTSTTTSTLSPIAVKIHANQKSWVSIVADGKTVMEGTLPEASDKAVQAKEQLVVVLGNVGGVEVSYNGKTLENLGKGAEVRKLTFTPSGYE